LYFLCLYFICIVIVFLVFIFFPLIFFHANCLLVTTYCTPLAAVLPRRGAWDIDVPRLWTTKPSRPPSAAATSFATLCTCILMRCHPYFSLYVYIYIHRELFMTPRSFHHITVYNMVCPPTGPRILIWYTYIIYSCSRRRRRRAIIPLPFTTPTPSRDSDAERKFISGLIVPSSGRRITTVILIHNITCYYNFIWIQYLPHAAAKYIGTFIVDAHNVHNIDNHMVR